MSFSYGENVTVALVLPFDCARCGHSDTHRAQATGRGVHEVSWSSLSKQVRQERAREARREGNVNARYNAYFRLKMSKCPQCERRTGPWMAWLGFIAALWGLGASLVPFALGVATSDLSIASGLAWGALPFGIVTAWKVRKELRDADAWVWFDSEHPGGPQE